MQKKLFLITGLRKDGTTATSPDYKPLRDGLKKLGYKVIPIDITWHYKTVSGFAKRFEKIYHQKKGQHNTILGSSFGAMAALKTAPILKPDQLILVSLSGLFREDLPKYPPGFLESRRIGPRRRHDLENISATQLAKQISQLQIPTTLTYGEYEKKDFPHLVARVRDTSKKIEQARVHEIPNTSHAIKEPSYHQPLLEIIKGL